MQKFYSYLSNILYNNFDSSKIIFGSYFQKYFQIYLVKFLDTLAKNYSFCVIME